ncbi:MAG: RsmE family RNA methyltransferase [Thermoguttaceae bacterium]
MQPTNGRRFTSREAVCLDGRSPVHLFTIFASSRPTEGDLLHAKRYAWTAGPLFTCSPSPVSDRYYLETAPHNGIAVLEGDEARHLVKVMRKAVGDTAVLFDGKGNEFDAVIESASKDKASLRIVKHHELPDENRAELTLAVALPKGERQKWMIEKLTELGCTRLIPLATARGVAKTDANVLERLKRGVIEAAKQCGASRLMEIMPEMNISGLTELVESQSNSAETSRWILHPSPEDNGPVRNCFEVNKPLVVLIGPEGGFTDAEVELAKNLGWQPIGLGSQILRIETAAIAISAAVLVQNCTSQY